MTQRLEGDACWSRRSNWRLNWWRHWYSVWRAALAHQAALQDIDGLLARDATEEPNH